MSECLKIAQHSVCCSQKVFARLSEPSLISERGVPTGEPCCGKAANRHYGLMAGLASGLRACETSGKLSRSIIRYASGWDKGCSRSPAATFRRVALALGDATG